MGGSGTHTDADAELEYEHGIADVWSGITCVPTGVFVNGDCFEVLLLFVCFVCVCNRRFV